MRKITFLLAFLATTMLTFGATGWYNDYVKINVNGAGTVAPTGWYWIGTDPTYATALQGASLGTVTSLVIEGCDMKYWSDTQDRTGGAFYYKVTNTAGTVEYIATSEVIWDQVSLGGNDYQGTKTSSIDVFSSLPTGTYKLQVWAKSWGGTDDYLSNSGANYVATFTKAYTGGPMSGTYKVGETITSNFNSLSVAVAALNANGVAGNVVLEITSNIVEDANIGLGVNTNTFGITIRPDADVDRTITFTKTTDNTSPSGHFVIGYTVLTAAWSDANTITTSNVTIDGYAVGGTTRRLKFTTASASIASSKLTVIVGACQNTIIKNCIYESKSTGGSAQCIGMVTRKGTAIEVGPIGVTIDNNIITSVASLSGQGINTTSSGTLTTVKTNGLVVKNNIITAQGRCGWFYYINGGDFDNNEFHLTQLGNANTVNYGLWTGTGTAGDFKIRNNKFIELTTMEATASGTLGMRGLSLSSGATYSIYNNTFAGMNRKSITAATVNLTYIFFGGTSGTIYNNTFYMPALTAPTTPGYYSAIQLSFANPIIKNNIFISNEDACANAFYSAISTGAIENNLLYHRAGNVNARFVTGAAETTFATYQAANPTKDINSKSGNVNFVDAATGDLRIAPASYQDANLQTPRLSEVLTDMFGASRYPQTYKGAHEAEMFIINEISQTEVSARIIRTFSGVEVILDNQATVEIYTVNGMMIDKIVTSGTYKHDLNNGVYIIRINGKATKFIK